MARINLTGILENLLGVSQIESEEQLDELINKLRNSKEDLISGEKLAELIEASKEQG